MNNLFNTELNYRELISKHGSPLLILDKATVRFQYKELARSLPNVTLHYALKPLPNKDVVASLIEEGASFDLASRGEIDLVRSLNINPMKCIHTHPIKKDQEIKYSLEYGCNTFVVDNAQEAKKFIPYKDEVKLLIRVSFPNPETPVDLSKKFGVLPKDCLELLKLTKSLGLNIHGLSFHVGSQVPNANRHVEAINEGAGIMKAAKENGIELNMNHYADFKEAKRPFGYSTIN